MNKINYSKLMAFNPTKYEAATNQLGQLVEFYEHPIHGDEYPVLAVIHSERAACSTGFYDLSDFYEGSEYMPVYMHGIFDAAFNFDLA